MAIIIDQTFDGSEKETYQYETLAGNNSRVALYLYSGLSDDQAIRLATKHKISLYHEMNIRDKK